MEPASVAANAATWAWSKYGTKILGAGSEKLKARWKTFNWAAAEQTYRQRMLEQLSTTRLLGYPQPIEIEQIYTDVYVLDTVSAVRRFNVDDLRGKPIDYEPLSTLVRRSPALDALRRSKRIYILGKPGAGKTTFLKYLAILACRGLRPETPIYIPLKEWSDSGDSLLTFMASQFRICGFPDATAFLKSILASGRALVLFDGLDEVNQEGAKRAKMIRTLSAFADEYPKCTCCLTCRIAASDYSFTQFTYLEIADFNEEQQGKFIESWYRDDAARLATFQEQWCRADNAGLRELGQTPLLLALICLAFDETLQFPSRRVDLYTEAIDALLKKWDSSRGLVRDVIYKRLSIERKKQLLADVAAITYQKEHYLIRRDEILSEVRRFVNGLPVSDRADEPEIDCEAVLASIEAQHGLLVERAYKIYSFSHLTFQEYFTARYIVANEARGAAAMLVKEILRDHRWREVVIMTSSLLHDCTQFLLQFGEGIWEQARKNAEIVELVTWVSGRAHSEDAWKGGGRRAGEHSNAYELALALAGEMRFAPPSAAQLRARLLAAALRNGLHDTAVRLADDPNGDSAFCTYLRLTHLFVECVHLSFVSDRARFDDMILRPPTA